MQPAKSAKRGVEDLAEKNRLLLRQCLADGRLLHPTEVLLVANVLALRILVREMCFFCCRTVAPEIRTVANLQCFLGFLEMDGISFFLGFLEMDGISFNLHMSPTSALIASWHRKAPSTFVICLKLWAFCCGLAPANPTRHSPTWVHHGVACR